LLPVILGSDDADAVPSGSKKMRMEDSLSPHANGGLFGTLAADPTAHIALSNETNKIKDSARLMCIKFYNTKIKVQILIYMNLLIYTL
jgi:hypothetical protein